jgi:hypothetical protein
MGSKERCIMLLLSTAAYIPEHVDRWGKLEGAVLFQSV